MKTPRIITSRFRAVDDFAATGLRPGFVPVRTSLGAPRFIPNAKAWPYLKELAPAGLLGLEYDEYRAGYLARLERFGVERIEKQLTRIAENYPGQSLALLCFEDVTVEWCHRSIFSEWWKTQTGERIAECNDASELPVSGWTWTGSKWERESDKPPIKLGINRRTR